MCGRAVLTASAEDLREVFGLCDVPPLAPRYNVAPTQSIAVVREPGKLELLRWGLSGGAPGELRINVRGESIAAAHREAFASRRCLVVVDGFYEWKGAGSGRRGREPFVVRRVDGEPFALAGIWQRRITADGGVVDECAVVTGAAQGALAAIHGRMPVVLSREGRAGWLTGGVAEARAVLRPVVDALTLYAVGARVNSAGRDDPGCLEPRGEAAPPSGGNLTLFD